jgi:hypothetical protein
MSVGSVPGVVILDLLYISQHLSHPAHRNTFHKKPTGYNKSELWPTKGTPYKTSGISNRNKNTIRSIALFRFPKSAVLTLKISLYSRAGMNILVDFFMHPRRHVYGYTGEIDQ